MILVAQDKDDLTILSARLQDAAAKLGDFVFLPKQRRFACVVNRLKWEDGGKARVRAGLHFDGVLRVRTQGVKLGAREAVVAILALGFVPNKPEEGGGEDPGGVVEMVLAGGGAIRLEVECIAAELADMTKPWTARATPDHGEA